jgi:hypothetical protein
MNFFLTNKSGQFETKSWMRRKLFNQVHQQRFTMEHAQRLLKGEPKWKGQDMNNSSKRSKVHF